jgi:hypothetical protein
MSDLRFINLDGCANVTSIEPLKALRNLQTLILGTQVDLGPLSQLSSLVDLHLHHSITEPLDMTPVAGLGNLRGLCAGAYDSRMITLPSSQKIRSPGVRDWLKSFKEVPASGKWRYLRSQRRLLDKE